MANQRWITLSAKPFCMKDEVEKVGVPGVKGYESLTEQPESSTGCRSLDHHQDSG